MKKKLIKETCKNVFRKYYVREYNIDNFKISQIFTFFTGVVSSIFAKIGQK